MILLCLVWMWSYHQILIEARDPCINVDVEYWRWYKQSRHRWLLHEPMLTNHPWEPVAFAWGQFHRKCSRFSSLWWVRKFLNLILQLHLRRTNEITRLACFIYTAKHNAVSRYALWVLYTTQTDWFHVSSLHCAIHTHKQRAGKWLLLYCCNTTLLSAVYNLKEYYSFLQWRNTRASLFWRIFPIKGSLKRKERRCLCLCKVLCNIRIYNTLTTNTAPLYVNLLSHTCL